jgi:hypothetical protein
VGLLCSKEKGLAIKIRKMRDAVHKVPKTANRPALPTNGHRRNTTNATTNKVRSPRGHCNFARGSIIPSSVRFLITIAISFCAAFLMVGRSIASASASTSSAPVPVPAPAPALVPVPVQVPAPVPAPIQVPAPVPQRASPSSGSGPSSSSSPSFPSFFRAAVHMQ